MNVLGCFALGLLEGIAQDDGVILFVLGRGVLAGCTTFSTLMPETLNLALTRENHRAFFNVVPRARERPSTPPASPKKNGTA